MPVIEPNIHFWSNSSLYWPSSVQAIKGPDQIGSGSGYVFKPITFPSLPKLQNKKNQVEGKEKKTRKPLTPKKCLEDASD